jgi:16S rRNA (cytosine967-C5)-methyltransferase
MSRKVAFQILLEYFSKGKFLLPQLLELCKKKGLSSQQQAWVQELTFGVVRYRSTLEHFLVQLRSDNNTKKTRLRLKEKVLLWMSIYQFFYLNQVPYYALLGEMSSLAKKQANRHFFNYFYMLLKRLPSTSFSLPIGSDVKSLSVAFSYPCMYIEELLKDHDIAQVKSLLLEGNQVGRVMARSRNPESWQKFSGNKVPDAEVSMAYFKGSEEIQKIAKNSDWYIQNKTPVILISKMSQGRKNLGKVLDLCSAPGGKALLVHDLFPDSQITVNDVNEKKMERLRENIKKYELPFGVAVGLGEGNDLTPDYDVVICDVPCSNTGVLHKKVEARWRLEEDNLLALEDLQLKILEKALKGLKPEGELWYLTCSILKNENEKLIEKACSKFGLKVSKGYHSILPDKYGGDGGFGCVLSRSG